MTQIDPLLEPEAPPPPRITNHLARLVLIGFIVTFVLARVLVILIMTRRMPNLFLHVGGTHVHHLNYGIFLLSGVGAFLLFRRPVNRSLDTAAIAYAVGLALTFDEFGMWVLLGGGYWQRASYDAVITVGAILGLIVYAPAWKRFSWYHRLITIGLLALTFGFALLLLDSVRQYGSRHGWESLQELEVTGPQ